MRDSQLNFMQRIIIKKLTKYIWRLPSKMKQAAKLGEPFRSQKLDWLRAKEQKMKYQLEVFWKELEK
jgi:hypothetical protein